jgi:imidazolonepropionase-like amidohydrolase
MRALSVAILLLVSSGAEAADLALVGGKVVQVSGPPIEGGTVLIHGDAIVAVGKDLAVPKGAEVIPCEGKWITPGLIEPHSQLGLVEISAISETVDFAPSSPDPIRAAARMDRAVNMMSLLIDVARRQGVTSAVAAPGGGLVSGSSAWLDLASVSTEAWKRAVYGPLAMHIVLGEGGAAVSGQSRALSHLRLKEVLDDARVYRREGAAFQRNALRKLATSRLDLEALLPMIDGKMKAVIDVRRASEIVDALRLAKEERLDVVLQGADEGWMVKEEIAAAKVPVIVNPMSNLPARFDLVHARSDNAVILAKAGVKVVLTTDTSHNAGGLRFHLGNAVRSGLPWEAALRSATLSAAEAFGRDKRYGSLERGKAANVVVWSGDPFEPSSYADTVVILGERQPTDTRQTHLRDRYKARLGL